MLRRSFWSVKGLHLLFPWSTRIYTAFCYFSILIYTHLFYIYIIFALKFDRPDSLPSCFLFTGPFKVPMPQKDPSCVYVGRPSDWGNPYKVEQYGRRVAIEKFEVYLLESGLISRIQELCGKRLYCHCFPQSCHASVLIKYAHELKIDIFE